MTDMTFAITITRDMLEEVLAGAGKTAPSVPAEPSARDFFGVPATHGAPHHNVKAIRAGDYVVEEDKGGFTRHGVARHQGGDGDWRTEDGQVLTWDSFRADRLDAVTVWPTPTPSATPDEEVALPTEHPAHILDVVSAYGVRCAHMALDRDGDWIGVDDLYGEFCAWSSSAPAAFTLPDGTRAVRDGKCADGTPRFVKVQEDAA